ncbi:MAG TPA: ATP-binding protein [Acidobacteriota bacterium]|nr:ATP-binding protein [Acidobacteriota bacterium]
MIRLNLRAKVLIFTLAIVAILLLTSHLVTNTMVASGLREQLEKRAEMSVGNFWEWLSSRKEQILTTARNLAESDTLPRAVDWTEPNYLDYLLQMQLSHREPEMLMVESTKYGWVFQTVDNPMEYGTELPLRSFELPEQQWQGGLTEVVLDGNRLILTVGVPIRFELEILGLLTVGSSMGSSALGDIRSACGCDHLSIITGGELLMSTYADGEGESIPFVLPEEPDRDRTYDIKLGGETYLSRIQRLPSATGETVALVLIQFSNAETRRLLESISNALNLTALGAFIVFSIISVFFSGRVTTKLKQLVSYVSTLGEGRYEEPVNVEAADEVGLLASSFEDLRLKLRQRTRELVSTNEDLDRRVKEIGILNRVMIAIASNLPMEDVFALISKEAGALLPVAYSYLVLRVETEADNDCGKPSRGSFRLLAWHSEQGAPGLAPPLQEGASLAEESLQRRELMLLDNLRKDSQFNDEAWMASEGLLSACVLPLLSDDAAIGAICLAGYEAQSIDQNTRNLLMQLATEITVALQRMRLNEELQLIESRLSRLFDSVRDGIFQTDPKGNIVFLNAAAQAMFGAPVGDDNHLQGKKFQEMILDSKEREKLLERLHEFGYVTNFAAILERADGTTFDADLSVNFTDGEVGQRGIEGIVRDVTARNELEQQLLRSERLASMGQIAAGVAHEINNPLGIVLGFTQDLQTNKPESDADQESLRVIEQETERCARIVKDLLNLARASETKHEPVDMPSLLDRTLKLYALQMRDCNIELKTEYSEVPPFLGDEQQLQQVFMNVFQNSINAMENKKKGVLRVGLEREGKGRAGSLVVTIRDNGRGIPEDQMDKIFDPFFSTRKESGGTGLGLFIVHRLIDAHGGSVNIVSKVGRGTTVKITLPAEPEK